ncbi:alpha-hydroxy acid oxidase [Cucumibacter marinus]|uniref:alpha-hydroxy acid oxidase n=1 Tax=Cucumibacter marinus TaxID=1121252 RepID=UPI00041F126D
MKVLEINDLKILAQRRVPRMIFGYADSGSFTESTYRANEDDFQKIKLRQRVGKDISGRSLRTTMLGQDYAMPLAISPTGSAGMNYPDGEMLAAKVCETMGIPYTLSTMSICSIEDVASVTKAPFWFQLYVTKDLDFTYGLIDRAKAAGCGALVLTLDLTVLGQRHKDLRNQLSAPLKITPSTVMQFATRPRWCLDMLTTKRRTFGNVVGHAKDVTDLGTLASWTEAQFDPSLSFKDVEWIKKRWGGKIILKGILDPEDAQAAYDAGADAIVVSNHGGRQLDGAPSSIASLPKVVDAVGSKLEVHMDSGVRSGQDVFKARALGAQGVFIGRPYLYGLGAMGKKGVELALKIIRKELDITMGLCGETDINDVGRHNLIEKSLDSLIA